MWNLLLGCYQIMYGSVLMSSLYVTHICSICNQRVGIDHNHKNDKPRHIGRVEIPPDFLPELLGFPGGKILHITQFYEETMNAIFNIEHPDMPEVYPGSQLMIVPSTYMITSIKRTENEVTIIAVRKNFR